MRLDQYLVKNDVISGRDKASKEIQDGLIKVNGKVITKPSFKVEEEDVVEYVGVISKYVSRGSLKLLGAIESFNLNIKNKVCLDVGASTGGFTQVLLDEGATKVFALDVGHSQLHKSLLDDERVVSLEGFNFRDEQRVKEIFNDNNIDIVVSDVSFISLKLLRESFKLIYTLKKDKSKETDYVLLIKPQFEVGRGKLNKKGIVTDSKYREEVKDSVITHFEKCGFSLMNISESQIKGSDGNLEYLVYFILKNDQ